MSSTPSHSDESDFEEVQLSCDVCKAVFSGLKPYEQHLKGSTHKKAVMKKKYKKQYLVAKKELTEGNATSSPLENGKVDDEEDDSANVYTCVPCKKICSGYGSYQLHLGGKQHLRQCRKQKMISELEKQGVTKSEVADNALYEIAPQIKPFASCNTCSKSFSGPEAYKSHMESQTHKKTLVFHALTKEMEESKTQFHKEEDSDDEDAKERPFCSDCNKIFSGPLPYKQHMISDAHKKQLKNLKCLTKVKDLAVVAEDDSTLTCNECGKTFSGPKPFKDHLKSKAHPKYQKKTKILSDIKAKYPEVVQKSDLGNSGGESSEEPDSVLACSVCHKAFSGPENAQEHFRSKKHLNSVKEKKKIDTILKAQKGRKSSSKTKQKNGVVQNGNLKIPAKTVQSSGNNANIQKKSVACEGDSEEEFEKILFPSH